MREVVVRGVSDTGLATHVDIGPHVLRADETVDQGGTDTGPEPPEMLLAALGTCTVMTLRLYASRKGWPLGNVLVRLGARTVDGHYAISRQITLEGTLDDEQRSRLIAIADRCPVHRTLTGTVVISTTEDVADHAAVDVAP